MTKEVRALLIQLAAWAQEELGAQRRLRDALSEQEQAIRHVDTQALSETGKRIEEEIAGGASRERRRARLMTKLGRAWAVDPSALTLASICERAGDGAEDLLRLRGELREEAAQVARHGRRITALARYHGGLLEEVMRVLVGEAGDANEKREGVLVNAKA